MLPTEKNQVILEGKSAYMLCTITFVGSHGDFSIDESLVQGANGVSGTVDVTSGGIQVPYEHDWSPNLQRQDVWRYSVD